jgi:hypothetical protein
MAVDEVSSWHVNGSPLGSEVKRRAKSVAPKIKGFISEVRTTRRPDIGTSAGRDAV